MRFVEVRVLENTLLEVDADDAPRDVFVVVSELVAEACAGVQQDGGAVQVAPDHAVEARIRADVVAVVLLVELRNRLHRRTSVDAGLQWRLRIISPMSRVRRPCARSEAGRAPSGRGPRTRTARASAASAYGMRRLRILRAPQARTRALVSRRRPLTLP